ncbi:MAG TPA: twin-arginine translocase TatA/TatE family subunit [Candidatus Limnocylindrales bacterium]|nr:twin-arginine translocase TatA/TatE family subunit [Candidatus Limnocylindrales bacterium]
MPFINGIGPLELIIVLVIALIVVGPGRLPDVGAALGKSIREFRQAASDTKDAVSLEQKPQSEGGPATTTSTAAPAPAATPVEPTAVGVAPAVPSAATAIAPPPPPASAPETVAPSSDPSAAQAAAPDVSELPEPVHAEDEQPTPTA